MITIIEDEFFTVDFQNKILDFFYNEDLPFFVVKSASNPYSNEYNPIFVHNIISFGQINSNLYFFIYPLVNICCNKHGLKVDEILRARLFIQPASIRNFNYKHDKELHIDIPGEDHVNLIYYANESDGGTYIYNSDPNNHVLSKFVEHRKGRFTIFNGLLYHAGSKPSSVDRVVLNVNMKVSPL